MICLAGFMGSGKTTVGTLLARQLAWRFVDLDARIEEAAGLNIPQIFEKLGEPRFREIEAEQLRAAAIPVVWLDSPIETLLARCMTMTGRPLFRDEAAFRALYAQRLSSYQQADYRVDSSGEPAQVVTEILRRGIVTTGGSEAHLVVEKPNF